MSAVLGLVFDFCIYASRMAPVSYSRQYRTVKNNITATYVSIAYFGGNVKINLWGHFPYGKDIPHSTSSHLTFNASKIHQTKTAHAKDQARYFLYGKIFLKKKDRADAYENDSRSVKQRKQDT